MKFLIVDAFAEQTFGGNPAGVVLLPDGADYPSDDVMVRTAAELRYSETAFIKQLGVKDFQVRYFTPVSEVDLCGHATIGSFCALAHLGIIADGSTVTAHTLAGDLAIEVKGSNVMMEMASPELVSVMTDPAAVQELHRVMGMPETAGVAVPLEKDAAGAGRIAAGAGADAFGAGAEASGADADNAGEGTALYPAIVSTGLPDIIMPVENRKVLASLAPDMEALARLSDWYGVTGVHVFTLDAADGVTAHARNFAPVCGIDEEAATGTASGAMTYYLYKNGVLGAVSPGAASPGAVSPANRAGKACVTADCLYIQGEAMGRPSAIRAELRVCADDAENPGGSGENPGGNGNASCRIRVGGSAAILAEGEIYL